MIHNIPYDICAEIASNNRTPMECRLYLIIRSMLVTKGSQVYTTIDMLTQLMNIKDKNQTRVRKKVNGWLEYLRKKDYIKYEINGAEKTEYHHKVLVINFVDYFPDWQIDFNFKWSNKEIVIHTDLTDLDYRIPYDYSRIISH